jgi:hypothetical protein
MPLIWCAISGHGYGHAAQVVPVLNALGRQVPHLTVMLRTTVSASFFQDRVTIPWNLQSAQQDVGCIQNGPLDIDIPATWKALEEFHAGWHARVAAEAEAMKTAAPLVVLADTPYLAASAAKQAGIPSVVVASFTWTDVLDCFTDAQSPQHHAILTAVQEAYGDADLGLRIAPGLPMAVLKQLHDIGPIAEPSPSRRAELRSCLRLTDSERLVLVGFGGIPLKALPWDAMEKLQGYHFIVDGAPAAASSRVHPLSSLPFSFKTVLASVDLVMTKPGYGTIVEAVALGLPVIYVRRYNFADEGPLVDFLLRYGCGHELSREDFFSGNWRPVFDALTARKAGGPKPSVTGATDAARFLTQYFQ